MIKILEASGTSLENVVKVNVYLANFDRDFILMNEVYLEVWPRVILNFADLMFIPSRGD